VFIYIEGEKVPSPESLAKYIVSHRTVSHFHEEICEMIYAHLTERFNPDILMVSCLYTRRGGIDINPIRATHQMLIPEFFTNPEFTIRKTLRQ
jgi:7-cyano-7-deazaguanine reductase